jgi:hypothetical protein
MEGPQKSNEINGLAAYRLSINSRADFSMKSGGCQPRATLQICNEKGVVFFGSFPYIQEVGGMGLPRKRN